MKKFEYYVSDLKVLSGTKDENLENEFVITGIIDNFFSSLNCGGKF